MRSALEANATLPSPTTQAATVQLSAFITTHPPRIIQARLMIMRGAGSLLLACGRDSFAVQCAEERTGFRRRFHGRARDDPFADRRSCGRASRSRPCRL